MITLQLGCQEDVISLITLDVCLELVKVGGGSKRLPIVVDTILRRTRHLCAKFTI